MSSGQSARPLLSLTPVRGDLQELDLTRAELRRGRTLASTLGECAIGGVPPGKRQNEGKKMLGTSAEQDDEKHVQLLLSSPSQRRSYRRPSTLTPVPASRVARSRCSDFYQTGAAIGLIWCSLGGIGAIFLPQKIDKKSLNSVTVHL